MTITAIAKQLGVTTMTVYRRCEKNGISIKDLRDDNGQLTPQGASIIASLFDGPQQPTTGDSAPQAVEGPVQAATAGDGETLAAVLQARVDGLQALVDALTDERDNLRGQVAQLTAALEREQADRQHERQLLTGDVDGQQRRGLFWWLRRR